MVLSRVRHDVTSVEVKFCTQTVLIGVITIKLVGEFRDARDLLIYAKVWATVVP